VAHAGIPRAHADMPPHPAGPAAARAHVENDGQRALFPPGRRMPERRRTHAARNSRRCRRRAGGRRVFGGDSLRRLLQSVEGRTGTAGCGRSCCRPS